MVQTCLLVSVAFCCVLLLVSLVAALLPVSRLVNLLPVHDLFLQMCVFCFTTYLVEL